MAKTQIELDLDAANAEIAALKAAVSYMTLMSISPVDGRYDRYTKVLKPIASEFGLIKYRIQEMILYLIALINHGDLDIDARGIDVEHLLKSIIRDFTVEDAMAIKQLETKGWNGIPATNHDVKSCEFWLRWKLEQLGLAHLIEWIHFAKTSEDTNNVAYALMLRDILGVVVPKLSLINESFEAMAKRYAPLSMLSRTHGQPATPTTLGKEFGVFARRLSRQLNQLVSFPLQVKLNGASGNYAAMYAAYPNVDWESFAKEFIESEIYIKGNDYIVFEQNELTTQIEPHDTYAELFAIFSRINTILIDFSQDMWRYVSDDWIVQRPVEGEIGSSAMPHKVNPIQVENSEGNLGLANALLGFCSLKLPISRLQRDLSDSTVERVIGVMFGHMIVSYENILGFMQKISANEKKIADVLNEHPEVLTEAYQNILRSVGYPNPYNVFKTLARGKKLTLEDLHAFIDSMDSTYANDDVKARMKALQPDMYVGIAPKLAIPSTI